MSSDDADIADFSGEKGATSLIIVGDVNLQHRDHPTEAMSAVLPALEGADLRFGNLEGCLFEPGEHDIPGKEGWQHSDEEMVAGLTAADFDAVGCANNVMYGDEPIRNTIAVLDAHGIAYCGIGETVTEACEPITLTAGGTDVGFLQRTARIHDDSQPATPDSPGVAYIDPEDREHVAELREDLQSLASDVDIAVFSYHLRQTTDRDVDRYQRDLARTVIDAGADVVVGHGAHVNQGIEVYDGAPVFHCIGQLAFDWDFARPYTDGMVLRFRLEGDRIAGASFVPVSRGADNDVYPAPPTTEEGRAQVEDVADRSPGVALDVRDDRVIVPLEPDVS